MGRPKPRPIPVDDENRQKLAERIAAGADLAENGCRLWRGFHDQYGYGRMRIRGGTYLAHRVSYQVHVGDAGEMLVCHRCDTPSCVEPSHLFAGTVEENNKDCTAKGRRARGDRNAARLYPERLSRGDKHWTRMYPERVPRGDESSARRHPERLFRGPRDPAVVLRGAKHGMAILTEDDVRLIRELVREKKATQLELAARYGVAKSAIWMIVARRNWKHVA